VTRPQSKSVGEQSYEQLTHHRYAARADTKAHNAYYERPATLSLLPDVGDKRVLDAGCGPGIYAEWLLDHGAEVVALDVTPDFVEITRRPVGDRAEVRCANLEQPLDFAADGSFDLVVCPLLLDTIGDWSPVFAEFHRGLRPAGVLVFSCGHAASGFFKYWNTGNHFGIELCETAWLWRTLSGGESLPSPAQRHHQSAVGGRVCA
jgi:SAM-dependent methyltransferase